MLQGLRTIHVPLGDGGSGDGGVSDGLTQSGADSGEETKHLFADAVQLRQRFDDIVERSILRCQSAVAVKRPDGSADLMTEDFLVVPVLWKSQEVEGPAHG